MTAEILLDLTKLRICVAYLGEKDQANWWNSSFLGRSGEAFLSPVFPKTATLARFNGASGAAQVSHDEHIGIGRVHHLFRLPENVEHDITQLLISDDSVLELVQSVECAIDVLNELSLGESVDGVGPMLIEPDTIDHKFIAGMAAAYRQGFSTGEPVYPYYRSKE